ncbi:LSU ribosomal protein L25P [Desulfocicer vacuolatum DSM 3385]|uniref:Large ribosomal subunit protein bL25 n=1 Tax=Desulfocicer vacuolatum DSM 3385 TaxID=1121400 RepID=A0A1W1YJZ0_9BACT|nr:50S ribosomal protein L25 [Desulfocicer vacuolatum]SMC36515.1 LSU ribosomal protein L25P [Desulfocicer vacuolatum DSM 3385]
MELIDLTGSVRSGRGKSAARALRKNELLPAVIYGPETEPVPVAVPTYAFSEIIRKNGTTGIFMKLVVDGDSKASRTVMLKDVQMDTFRLNYLHADFQEINLDNTVTVTIPVETNGESKGEKEGGMVQVIRRELDVICRPADAPESIVIDIADLEIGDSVHVESIDLGADVEIPHEVNFTVLTVVPPSAAEQETTEDDDELDIDVNADADAEEEAPADE